MVFMKFSSSDAQNAALDI